MQFGKHLHELWRLRWAVPLCLAVALFAALSTAYHVSLLPPKLTPKALEMGTASAHVLVDTPSTTVLDLRQGTGGFDEMTHRAVLLGNVMASLPVRQFIARRAHVPAELIEVTTPTTPEFPRRIADAQHQPHVSDLAASPDRYLIKVWANPTVPVLDIYAEGPTAKAAEQLANGAADGLRDYLAGVSRTSTIPGSDQVTLRQLGRGRGVLLNPGVHAQVALLAFFLVLALASATALFIGRVQRGWRRSQQAESDARSTPGARAEHAATPEDDEPEQLEWLPVSRQTAGVTTDHDTGGRHA